MSEVRLRIRTGFEWAQWVRGRDQSSLCKLQAESGMRLANFSWQLLGRLRFSSLQNQEPRVPISSLHNVPIEQQQSCLYVVTAICNDSKAKKEIFDFFCCWCCWSIFLLQFHSVVEETDSTEHCGNYLWWSWDHTGFWTTCLVCFAVKSKAQLMGKQGHYLVRMWPTTMQQGCQQKFCEMCENVQ